MIPTEDPDCYIINQTDDSITYQTTHGEKWIIYGQCNKCGKCLPPDWIEPARRLDIPVRPEIHKIPECSLKGEYLGNN